MHSLSTISNEKLSAREKIMLEKQLPHKSKQSLTGPSLDYFFHELKYEEKFLQRWVTKSFGILLLFIALLIFPFVAIGLLLSGTSTILIKRERIGFRGHSIKMWQFPTKTNNDKTTRFGRFLHSSGLYKLPWAINIIKGELLLVGPKPLLKKDSMNWTNTLDEFYKRYATKPGFFVIGNLSSTSSEEQVTNILQKEFDYVLKPTLKKDIDIILDAG